MKKSITNSHLVWHHHKLLAFTNRSWFQLSQDHSAHILFKSEKKKKLKTFITTLQQFNNPKWNLMELTQKIFSSTVRMVRINPKHRIGKKYIMSLV